MKPTTTKEVAVPCKTLLTALVTLAALTPPATAGTYTVHTCKTPSGEPLDMEGWTASSSVSVVGRDGGSITRCTAAGQAAEARLGHGGFVAPGSWLRWTIEAPSGTTISSLRLLRSVHLGWPVVPGEAERRYAYQAWHGDRENVNIVEMHSPFARGEEVSWSTPTPLDRSDRTWRSFSASLRCWGISGSYDCGDFPASLAIDRATIGFTDGAAPLGASYPSPLRGDTGPVRGLGTLAFSATDSGGGVYRSILRVDGEEVERSVVDPNVGRCGDVEAGNGDAYEFGTPQPCPLMTDGAATFDTRGLRDGTHAARLEIEDAAGNTKLVHDGLFRTHNAPVSTAAPTLDGDPRVGGLFAVDPGEWDGDPTALEHRWLRCDAVGANCTPIAGAAGATYSPTDTDAYHRLVAEVTAHNPSGAAVARTAPSTAVADGDGRTRPDGPRTDPDPDPTPGDDRRAPAPGGGGGDQEDDPPAGPAATTPPRIDDQGVGGLANPVAGAGGHAGNGTNASKRARISIALRSRANANSARRVRVSHGRRAILVGRVTDEQGRPIANAELNVASRVGGRRWTSRVTVRSDADGRITVNLSAGPSRRVRLTYFAFADSRTFVSSDTVDVEVVSPVTVRADRHRVTGKRVVTLSGTAGGRPMPARGVLVTLQGHQAGYGWRTFRTVRTDRAGRWSTRYRFRSPSGRFAFRAIVPEQGGHPYATARSRPVSVRVS